LPYSLSLRSPPHQRCTLFPYTTLFRSILSLALLAWIARVSRRRSATDLLLVAITASALASYHILIQDVTILLLPVLVMMDRYIRSEEHTSELQSRFDLVCRLLLEKKKH